MKRIIIASIAFLMTLNVWSQSPDKMSYQAVIRDTADNLLVATTLGMQISILQGSPNGMPVYVETHAPTTNANGLVSLEIGTGTTLDVFSDIDWSNGPYYIKTETDITGGTNYTITGVSQLMSVPYALYAKTAGNTEPGPQGEAGVGISSTIDNNNGTFTLNFSDGSSFTTADLTGPQGATGVQGPVGPIGLTGPQGAQGLTGTAGSNGQDGVGISSTIDNNNGTFTLNFSDGSSFTTADLTGPQGATGVQGPVGPIGLTGPQGAQGLTGTAGSNGQDGVGISSTTDNNNGTFTLNFSDGSTQLIDLSILDDSEGVSANSLAINDLKSLSSARIYVGNASGEATAVNVTGAINIDNTGVTSLSDAVVTSPKLADASVTTSKLEDQSITEPKLDKTNIAISGFGAAIAEVDLGSQRITNVADPTEAQDAATKNYTYSKQEVDALLAQAVSEAVANLEGQINSLEPALVADFDGNIYPYRNYGNQVWTVKNAKMVTYRDGTPIPQVTDGTEWVNLTTGAWCYFNNDPTKHRLYNWYAVMGINDNDASTPNKEFAPEGWHVPTDQEWTTLENYLIANGYNYEQTATGNTLAKAMASTSLWVSPSIDWPSVVGNDQSTNNSSGFNAFPEAYRFSFSSGGFDLEGYSTFFWTSSPSSSSAAWNRNFYTWEASLDRGSNSFKGGNSVRFVKD